MNCSIAIACTAFVLSACERSQVPSGRPIDKPASTERTLSPPSSAQPSSTPASASPLRFPEQPRLALGSAHSCFLDKKKQVWCWGSNLFGEIGNGKHGWTGSLEEMDNPDSHVSIPYRLPLTGVSHIAARDGQSCAVDKDSTFYAWGMGEGPQKYEQRFVDKPIRRKTPQPAVRLSPGLKTCIVGKNGLPYCAGLKTDRQEEEVANRSNEYGFYDFKLISDLGPILDIASSLQATCAVRTDTSIWCWGINRYGELGKSRSDSATPVMIASLNATRVYAGNSHFCSKTEGGQVTCWGANWDLQSGAAQTTPSMPTSVELPDQVVQMALGTGTTLALLKTGKVYRWGAEKLGVLNTPEDKSFAPVRVSSLSEVIEIAIGNGHACVLRADETVWCWGQGDDYQLGNGKNDDSSVPVKVI